ncbi:hypothetical protein V9L20_02910 [Variovorax sp. CCNWLW225]|jgi:hypothetical protein|uniref:hypothetical protein n=1 Tax=Variovorax sp. CCNWLW225 TaxID=3127462 RepID=UPI003076C691
MMTIPFEVLDPQHRGVKEWSRRAIQASMTWEVMARSDNRVAGTPLEKRRAAINVNCQET